MRKILKSAVLFILAFSPVLAFAQVTVTNSAVTACTSTGVGKIICQIDQLLNSLIPVLIALGVVYFVWGVVQFVIAGGEEAKTKGRDKIIYGIIGLAVIVGLWGLVNIVVNTFSLGGQTLNSPQLLTTTSAASSGAACTFGTNIQTGLGFFTCLINNSIIPFIFALAIIMFIWGVVKFFIINADEEAKREQGKQFMIWGIIALAVMTCVWGLVSILGGTFGISSNALPQVTPPGSSANSSSIITTPNSNTLSPTQTPATGVLPTNTATPYGPNSD